MALTHEENWYWIDCAEMVSGSVQASYCSFVTNPILDDGNWRKLKMLKVDGFGGHQFGP